MVNSTVKPRVSRIEKIINRVTELATAIAAIALGGLVLLVTTDVLRRYFLNKPIQGSDELTTYMMVGIGFLGLGLTALNNQHIKVEIIVDRFPRLGQKIMDIINYCVVTGVSGLLGIQAFKEGMLSKKMGLASSITGIPQWPFFMIVTLGFGLLFISALMLLARTVSKEGKE